MWDQAARELKQSNHRSVWLHSKASSYKATADITGIEFASKETSADAAQDPIDTTGGSSRYSNSFAWEKNLSGPANGVKPNETR
jgi:hypothetical protein